MLEGVGFVVAEGEMPGMGVPVSPVSVMVVVMTAVGVVVNGIFVNVRVHVLVALRNGTDVKVGNMKVVGVMDD